MKTSSFCVVGFSAYPCQKTMPAVNVPSSYPHAHEIIPGVYLGNEVASRDPKFFDAHKIRAVLNMTHDLPCPFKHRSTIDYATVPVDDSLKQKDFNIMENALPFAVSFIHKNVRDKKPLLVHCYMGAQRSATAVAAFLMRHKPELAPTLSKAVKYVHSKRPIAWHNGKYVNFETSLKGYRKSHVLTAPIPKKLATGSRSTTRPTTRSTTRSTTPSTSSTKKTK